MSVDVCVCLYLCVHVCVCICAYTYIHWYACVYVCVCVRVCHKRNLEESPIEELCRFCVLPPSLCIVTLLQAAFGPRFRGSRSHPGLSRTSRGHSTIDVGTPNLSNASYVSIGPTLHHGARGSKPIHLCVRVVDLLCVQVCVRMYWSARDN